MPLKHAVRSLFSPDALWWKARELARRISADCRGQELLLVCILKGAYVFLADLARHLTVPAQCDFMRVVSYGRGTRSRGRVDLLLDVTRPLRGRHVLIVEDIVDTGRTLDFVRRRLARAGPESLRTCVLLDKPSGREVPVPLEYVAFTIPDVYVVGYGLDWAERYRELPYVGVLEPSSGKPLRRAKHEEFRASAGPLIHCPSARASSGAGIPGSCGPPATRTGPA